MAGDEAEHEERRERRRWPASDLKTTAEAEQGGRIRQSRIRLYAAAFTTPDCAEPRKRVSAMW